MGIKLGLLSLAEFLLCELYAAGSEGGRQDWPCPTHLPLPHSWNPGREDKKLAVCSLLCNPDQVTTLLWALVCPSVKCAWTRIWGSWLLLEIQ